MRSEMCEEVIRPQQIATETLSVEKQQEQELMARLASNGRIAPKPKSVFLQKKLQHHRVSLLIYFFLILNCCYFHLYYCTVGSVIAIIHCCF